MSVAKIFADFSEFMLSRAPYFLIENSLSQQVPRTKVYGEIDPLSNKASVTREFLEEFKDHIKIDLRTILKIFEDNQVIVPTPIPGARGVKKRYTKAKRIKYLGTDIVASVYELDLSKISETLAEEVSQEAIRQLSSPNPLAEFPDDEEDEIPF
jgi:hypothetical protein